MYEAKTLMIKMLKLIIERDLLKELISSFKNSKGEDSEYVSRVEKI
jgi:hypothetical protein